MHLESQVYYNLLSVSDAMTTPDSSSSFVEELHKRWFDNVKDYMDKKKTREENEASSKKLKTK